SISLLIKTITVTTEHQRSYFNRFICDVHYFCSDIQLGCLSCGLIQPASLVYKTFCCQTRMPKTLVMCSVSSIVTMTLNNKTTTTTTTTTKEHTHTNNNNK
ncbi:hypothetical protein EGW08_015224, partial [Elysia chlorotica]